MAVVQVPMFAIGLAALGVAAAVQAEQVSRRTERALVDAAPVAIVAVDRRGLVSSWNTAAEQMFGYSAEEVIGRAPPMIPPAERIPIGELLAADVSNSGRQVEYVHRIGSHVVGKLFSAPLRDTDGEPQGVLSVIEDITALAWLERRQALLSTALDAAAEAIVVTDLTPRILYANPAASATSGRTSEELLGHNPSIFASGLHDQAFFEKMWATITAGQTWRGVLVNRRKNGELYDEQTSITPVRDGSGAAVAYVAVQHDLTAQRRLEADIEQDKKARNRVLAIMEQVHAHENMYETATALCQAVVLHTDFDVAVVLIQQADGSLEPIGEACPLVGSRTGRLLTTRSGANEVIALTSRSAWWISTDAMPPKASRWRERFSLDGLVATAYAPMRWESHLFGVLLVASRDPSAPTWVEHAMPMLTEIGSFGGVLIGAQIEELRTTHELRDEIRDVIDHRRFRPVFQRYVDLATGEVRGFEALTRFDDGTRPDRKIHEAWLAGMGEELEAACARAAIEAADDLLAPEQSLSVNFSPLSVLHGTAAHVVRTTTRPVVIEVTEHTAIDDYEQLRRALHECGPIKVSVDDAGAGFSSLRHILELCPDVVKLDIGLIKGIDTDLARQALVAGLCHYAADTGTLLIAEGVETAEEAATVRRLGVHYGQGFHFGRPSPTG
jgi:PAS domain S-box-containing protein